MRYKMCIRDRLYGILTLTLCGGDAFHLVPRIIRAVRGTNDKIKKMCIRDSILSADSIIVWSVNCYI